MTPEAAGTTAQVLTMLVIAMFLGHRGTRWGDTWYYLAARAIALLFAVAMICLLTMHVMLNQNASSNLRGLVVLTFGFITSALLFREVERVTQAWHNRTRKRPKPEDE